MDPVSAPWPKSPRSHENSRAEVASVDPNVAVRDSKDRDGPVLVFTGHEEAFIGEAQSGEEVTQ